MWLPDSVVAAVDRVAHIHYVNVIDTTIWNKYRKPNELRLLTGWCWTTKDHKQFRQGFKTVSVCYRDAFYSLVAAEGAPPIEHPKPYRPAPKQPKPRPAKRRPQLRVVGGRSAA